MSSDGGCWARVWGSNPVGFLINFLVNMNVRYVVICFGIFEDDDCSRLFDFCEKDSHVY